MNSRRSLGNIERSLGWRMAACEDSNIVVFAEDCRIHSMTAACRNPVTAYVLRPYFAVHMDCNSGAVEADSMYSAVALIGLKMSVFVVARLV